MRGVVYLQYERCDGGCVEGRGGNVVATLPGDAALINLFHIKARTCKDVIA